MTPSHLQSLIADLDRLLSQSSSRLSWSTSDTWAEREQIRQLLREIRAYLAALDSQSSPIAHAELDFSSTQEQLVEQITSAVIVQINHQLAHWFDSLGAELDDLRQQRQSLVQNIQSLQQQYQQMIANFMQLLMKRSQDVLQQQIDQTQETIAQQLRVESSVSINPSAILEQLIKLQQHSDQLLTHLDTTFRTVFETLEQDLQAHSQSLSQGLERMHGLGQQGEVKLLAYMNRLSEHLQQTISPPPLNDLPTPPEDDLPAIDKIRLLTDLIPLTSFAPSSAVEQPAQTPSASAELLTPHEVIVRPQGWYLGIDFGTTSLSAVLSKINPQNGESNSIEEYPLYWATGEASSFRLPTTVYSSIDQTPPIELDHLKFLLNQTESLSQDVWLMLLSLFSTLKSTEMDWGAERVPHLQSRLRVMTDELSQSCLQSALNELEGIIFSIPNGWGEPYRSQLKSAVEATHLVQDDKPIFFLEEAIATFLAHLPLTHPSPLSLFPSTTLVINCGATTTDLALVSVANPLESLSDEHFLLATIAYGGDALEQDIFCQLIYPQWLSQLNPSFSQLAKIIPQAGTPDLDKRAQLKQRLQANPIGSSFLEAAKLAKLILQQQESFTSQLGHQPWTLQRYDLEKIVISPFLAYLEEQIQSLLSQKNLSFDDIGQVIASGGTTLALWHCLSAFFKTKLPQAIVFHDDQTELITTVAKGLGRLPFFPYLMKAM